MIFFFSNIFFWGSFFTLTSTGSVLVNKSHRIKRKVVEVQLLRTKFHETNTSIGLWHWALRALALGNANAISKRNLAFYT